MNTRSIRVLFSLAIGLGAALSIATARAEINEVVIQSVQPYGQFAAGRYKRIEGEARGALSPQEAIPDLEKAPRNASGRVEYRTRFTLLMPESPGAGNGALLVDVPNRGRPISHAFYNSPRSRPILAGSLDEGTGFLQTRGFSVVVVQWELGEGIEPPVFVDAGGNKRYVEGVGFAAVRDMALFLRHNRSASNPLAGAIDRTYVAGYSQTGRFLKSFLTYGFNELDGRRAFDGFHIVAAAAGGLPLLGSGPGPQSVASSTPSHAAPDHRGVHEEPFHYADVIKRLREKNRTVPLVMVTHMHNDYLASRSSLTRTGGAGTVDLPMPSNVRMYDIAGAAHMNEREQNKACLEPHGQLDWSPALRAQLIALDEWARRKTPPPPSQLMSLEPRPGDRTILGAPSYIAGATVLVPRLDDGGNAVGGIRLPDVEVPTATHGNLNSPQTNGVCRLAGTTRPFARNAGERKDGDSRITLEERYPGGINEYTSRMRSAVRALVAQRLLLEEDGNVIVNAAAENAIFRPTPPRSRGATTAAQR